MLNRAKKVIFHRLEFKNGVVEIHVEYTLVQWKTCVDSFFLTAHTIEKNIKM